LSCQHKVRHPFTGADPGGWGWTDLSGAVPDADDTPGALLALWPRFLAVGTMTPAGDQVFDSALLGMKWLVSLQNTDGGWPTFCRGWGRLPFDRSGTDLTAHAMRAIYPWETLSGEVDGMYVAYEKGLRFLSKKQNPDGSWSPLWFGNQHHPEEDNPIYGTAKVLLAYRDIGLMNIRPAVRGIEWLARNQNPDGSFGHSVEETALAVEGLLCWPDHATYQDAIDRGLTWLVERVEQNQHTTCSPIGFYFAKLWYYERLYPLIFTVGTLRQAVEHRRPPAP
jgi:squalene-hopene/tetraprenyl-beta-curcumene cyclase